MHYANFRKVSVSDYGCKYKSICDQLAANGHSVDEAEKIIGLYAALGLLWKPSPQLTGL